MIFNPPLVNSAQVIPIIGGILGQAELVYACTTFPSAGTVTLEYQPAGSSAWVLAKGTNGQTSTQPATAQASWEVYSAASAIRITFASLAGGSGAILAVSPVNSAGFPQGAFTGLRALTVQSFEESNVKNGTQFEAGLYVASVAASSNQDLLFITGALPVSIKSFQAATTATIGSVTLYSGPTTTQGTQIPAYNRNTNPAIAKTLLSKLYQATGTTATGTQVAATTYFLGTASVSPASLGDQSANSERQLMARTGYLVRFSNMTALAVALTMQVAFYEGFTDLPIS